MRTRLSALWVRNLIGAVVTIAAIAVLFVTVLREPWAEYRRTVVPGVVIPAGRSGEADGRTYKLDAIRHMNRSPVEYGPKLPDGTVLAVITVERSGSPPTDAICNGVITDGTHRWKAENVGGILPPQSDGVTSLCNQPGLLQFAFVLPLDVVPTAMDIVTIDGQIMVRMLV